MHVLGSGPVKAVAGLLHVNCSKWEIEKPSLKYSAPSDWNVFQNILNCRELIFSIKCFKIITLSSALNRWRVDARTDICGCTVDAALCSVIYIHLQLLALTCAAACLGQDLLEQEIFKSQWYFSWLKIELKEGADTVTGNSTENRWKWKLRWCPSSFIWSKVELN